MKLITLSFFIFLVFTTSVFAQNDSIADGNGKKILNHSLYPDWKRLDNSKISDNGEFISYEILPMKGDGNLFFKTFETNRTIIIPRSTGSVFSPESDFAAFKIKTPEDSIRKLKLKKVKSDNFPKDSLGIIIFNKENFEESKIFKYPNLNSFKIPAEENGLIAFTTEIPKNKKDSTNKNSSSLYNLNILRPVDENLEIIENVSDYTLSDDGAILSYIVREKNEADESAVYKYNTKENKPELVFKAQGYAENITISKDGNKVAFLFSQDTTKIKRYELFLNDKKLADSNSYFLPVEWEISKNNSLNFSKDGSKLYFNIAPKVYPEPKDTIPSDEKFNVDIWTWQDPYLQTQQLHDLNKDKEKSYTTLYDISSKKFIQLENLHYEKVSTVKSGNSPYAMAIDLNPYKISSSWIQPEPVDIYSINMITGESNPVVYGVQQGYNLSASGKYIVWFESSDTSWYAYSNETGSKYQLTKNLNVKFGNELNDVPNLPDAYGIGGWTTNDNEVLIYDRFDVWKINPLYPESAVRLTNGRELNTVFRYQDLNKDSVNISPDEKIIFKAINETNWQESLYELSLNQPELKLLVTFDNKFTSIIKAKNSAHIIFQKMSYVEYPDLWKTNSNFTGYQKISETNPEQVDYNWGTVEIINWKGFKDEDLKGLLYKPENFDSSKKYPVITYFYEKYTDRYHQYYGLTPSRSVINFPLYNSNGYIIFIPDITYEIGYPGRSAYNVILSGAQYLADNFSYVDRDNMAIQGQSWGGYQVAYMVTQTGFFKAAMAGAPVSNMTSAYGGIRWESGVNRIFQYEKEQSRIGGTLWDKFDLYIENSPLFKANEVTTPLLIMANDGDGAVPWQQGIEFFVSLRRLEKKVWLLNYNGDEHNLMKWPNRVDLSIRMMQFFDHYLKDKPMPEWMKEGIPALKKGQKTGY